MALPTGAYEGQDLANWQEGNKFLPREYYSLKPYTAPTIEEEQVTETFGIPYTNAFTGGGGDGGGGGSGAYTGREYNPDSYVTNRGYLSGDYIQGTEPQPNRLQKFGQMVGEGIMNFVPGMKFIRGLDRFNTLSPADQEFARQQMSFNEGSAFDNMGNLPNQDRYGYNKRSLMGNYANVIDKRVKMAKDYFAEHGKYRDIDQYYLDKEEDQNKLIREMQFNDFMRQRHSANKIRAMQAKNIQMYPGAKGIHGEASEELAKKAPISVRVPQHIKQPDTPSGGGQFDGASSRAEYDRAPTDYSGSFAKGGRVPFFYGGLAGIL